jgi:hypothetical protein
VSQVAVCTRPELAAALRAGDFHVVLCGPDPTVPATATTTPATASGTGGRLAVFVGDPDRPEVMEAAVAMARELFGADPFVVRTEAEAARLLAVLPGSQQT